MSPPAVAAVVLNWNQSRLTADCVAALRKSARPCDRIVIVDNGSRPDQRAILDPLTTALDVSFVPLRANRGFAGGMNAGIREAAKLGSEYAWLVNNDAFPDPDCLDALLAAMAADPTLACVTPRLVGTDGIDQPAGGRYHAADGGNEFLGNAALRNPVGQGGYWAVATAPLFRTAALAAAGGFDERFFAYWEEADLCLRLAARGYRFRAVPEVSVLHLGRASSAGSNFAHYLYVRNQFWMLRKHPPGGAAAVVGLARRHLDNAGCYAARGDAAKAQTVVEAVVAGLRREQGRPRRFETMPRLARAVAGRPWRLVRGLAAVERLLDRPGGVA